MSSFAVETVNRYALVGLEQLEKLFPILQQPTDEVSVWEWNLSNSCVLQLPYLGCLVKVNKFILNYRINKV